MTPATSPTPLDQPITAWLAHQRALGRQYEPEEWVLSSLRKFISQTPGQDLDRTSFDQWCAMSPHLASNTMRHRQHIVRRFCLHRRRKERDCFVPNPLVLRPVRALPAPRHRRTGANSPNAECGGGYARRARISATARGISNSSHTVVHDRAAPW
jgi:hypothetical protein